MILWFPSNLVSPIKQQDIYRIFILQFTFAEKDAGKNGIQLIWVHISTVKHPVLECILLENITEYALGSPVNIACVRWKSAAHVDPIET